MTTLVVIEKSLRRVAHFFFFFLMLPLHNWALFHDRLPQKMYLKNLVIAVMRG